MAGTHAGEDGKRRVKGAADEVGQGLGLRAQAVGVGTHHLAARPSMAEIPDDHGKRADEETREGPSPSGARARAAPQRESREGGDRIAGRDRLLPEGGAEEQPHCQRAQAVARRWFVLEQRRQQGEREPAQGEHVYVLADGIEREDGQELWTQGQVQPARQGSGAAADAPRQCHGGHDEQQIENDAGQHQHPREVLGAAHQREERGQVALQRALIVRADGEDGRGPRAGEKSQRDEGAVRAIRVDPAPGMQERGQAIGDGEGEDGERLRARGRAGKRPERPPRANEGAEHGHRRQRRRHAERRETSEPGEDGEGEKGEEPELGGDSPFLGREGAQLSGRS